MKLGEKLSDQQCYYNYFEVGRDSGTKCKVSFQTGSAILVLINMVSPHE